MGGMVVDAATSFGAVLRRLSKAAGLTQKQLALEADLRRTYVSILELGQQQPTLTTILKLASALGQSAGEMVALVEVEIARGRKRRC